MIELKFNLDEKPVTVQVTFMYPDKHKPVHLQKTVICQIKVLTDKVNARGGRVWELFNRGLSRCNSLDRFDKRIGRKVSFSKTVSIIKEKNIRELFWKAFFEKYGY